MTFIHRVRAARLFGAAAAASIASAFAFSAAPSVAAGEDGRSIPITIEANHTVRTVDRQLLGLNTAAWDSRLDTLATTTLLRETSIASLRYPGGSWADSFDWTRPKWRGMPLTEEFASLAESVGADGSVILNYGSGTPEMDAAWAAYCLGSPKSTAIIGVDRTGKDWKTVGFWATVRASSPLLQDDGFNLLRAGHPAPYPIVQFEVGNECYGTWETDTNMPKQDPVLYSQFFARTYSLIKSFAPAAKIGAVVTGEEDADGDQQETVVNPVTRTSHSGWTAVVLSALNGLNVIPDFVIFHYYPQEPGSEDDAGLLKSVANWPASAVHIRAMLTDYFHGRAEKTQIQCTENNSVTFKPGKQTTSLVDGLYLASSFGEILQTDFKGFYWWCLRGGPDMRNNNSSQLYGWRNFGDYGVVYDGGPHLAGPEDSPYPTYRALQLLSHFCRPGDAVVKLNGAKFPLEAYAVKRQNNALSVLLIDSSPIEPVTVSLSWTGFRSAAGAATWSFGKTQDRQQSQGLPGDLAKGTIKSTGRSLNATIEPYTMEVVVVPPK